LFGRIATASAHDAENAATAPATRSPVAARRDARARHHSAHTIARQPGPCCHSACDDVPYAWLPNAKVSVAASARPGETPSGRQSASKTTTASAVSTVAAAFSSVRVTAIQRAGSGFSVHWSQSTAGATIGVARTPVAIG